MFALAQLCIELISITSPRDHFAIIYIVFHQMKEYSRVVTWKLCGEKKALVMLHLHRITAWLILGGPSRGRLV